MALDLSGLYEQILRRHLPISARPGESLPEHVARLNAICAKTREREQIEARLAKEKQFNRKVETNAALRTISQELASLHEG